MMAKLIPNDEGIKDLSRNVLQNISIQGVLSTIFTSLVYIYPSVATFFSQNFWIFYVAVGLYPIFALIRVFYKFPSPLANLLILYCIIICSVTFDTAAASLSPMLTFQVITLLFSGIFGLFLYYLVADRLKSPYWLLIFTFVAVDFTFAGFCIAGFDILQTLMFAAIAFVYSAFIFWALSDVCERYSIKQDDYSSAGIFVYFDILVLPFIVTKFQRIR